MKVEPYQELEKKYAKWGGKKFGIAVNSGTAALHLSLLALGVKAGDEVIVPDFAFASVAFSVTYCGATPVFVDIDDDYNINPEKVKEALTEKTKAIIAVHTYGRKAKVKEIQSITNVPIIEDVCEAQGISLCPNTIAVYSLYENKILPAEEGGIVLTDDEGIYKEISLRKNMANVGGYYHTMLGFNYRMTNSQANLGLKSFDNKESLFVQRGENLQKYLDNFGGRKPDVPWVFDMLSDNAEEIVKNIPESRSFFKPQSSFPIYNQISGKRSLEISKRGFIISLYPQFNHYKIIENLKRFLTML